MFQNTQLLITLNKEGTKGTNYQILCFGNRLMFMYYLTYEHLC